MYSRSNNKVMESEELSLIIERGISLASRSITISCDIDENLFLLIDAGLTEMERQSTKKPITIKINSQGGSMYDALAIVGRMKNSKCHIVTEGYGSIMSAATILLAAGDTRKISKFAWFVHHEAGYTIDGRHSHIKEHVAQMEREEKTWARWMEELTSTPAEMWVEFAIKSDAHFSPHDLLELGVVDLIF